MSSVAETLAAIGVALDGVGRGWYLFGAQAALLRGSRRVTTDVDITVLPGDTEPAEILARLRSAGFSPRFELDDEFLASTRVLPLRYDAHALDVDIVLGGPGLEELFLGACESMDVGGAPVPVPTAEHLITMKLLAGRAKDLEDAEAVARAAAPDLTQVAALVDAIAEGLGEDDIRRALEELERRLAKR